jgi:2,4-dienoyl-CoA reductase-like NADH-dependent reductase (Old Yellow Enzyme family)
MRCAPPFPLTLRFRCACPAPTGIDQTIAFARAPEARGCAAMHVSSGGLTSAQLIPVGPSYQVPLARAVKKATRMRVIAVGLITEFD